MHLSSIRLQCYDRTTAPRHAWYGVTAAQNFYFTVFAKTFGREAALPCSSWFPSVQIPFYSLLKKIRPYCLSRAPIQIFNQVLAYPNSHISSLSELLLTWWVNSLLNIVFKMEKSSLFLFSLVFTA